jgi:hypothetical protein
MIVICLVMLSDEKKFFKKMLKFEDESRIKYDIIEKDQCHQLKNQCYQLKKLYLIF